MKDNSNDIPAIKFYLCGSSDSNIAYNLNDSTEKMVDFDQVDGLSISDIIEFFGFKSFLLVGLINQSTTEELNRNVHNFYVGLRVNYLDLDNIKDKDIEISKYICDSFSNFEWIFQNEKLGKKMLKTFVARYRGEEELGLYHFTEKEGPICFTFQKNK